MRLYTIVGKAEEVKFRGEVSRSEKSHSPASKKNSRVCREGHGKLQPLHWICVHQQGHQSRAWYRAEKGRSQLNSAGTSQPLTRTVFKESHWQLHFHLCPSCLPRQTDPPLKAWFHCGHWWCTYNKLVWKFITRIIELSGGSRPASPAGLTWLQRSGNAFPDRGL